MSVTTVPIPPIAKSTLAKLWIGIVLLIIFAVGLAYAGTNTISTEYQTNEQFLTKNLKNNDIIATESGLQIQTIKAGEGPSPKVEDTALVNYKGTFRDGTVFDEGQQAPFPVGRVVPGFSEALQKMQKGGEYKIWIPSDLGYGPNDLTNPQTGEVLINPETGKAQMPGGSLLIFEVTMIDYKTQAEIQELQQAAESLQGASGGAPQGLPPELQKQLEEQFGQ